MTMQDPIADMLTRIRNAQSVGRKSVTFSSSKMKVAIAAVLKNEGFITEFEVTEDAKPELKVELKYFQGKPVITTLRRMSRPGLRVYKTVETIPSVKGGLGLAILSTNLGLMSDREARKRNVGGEVICIVT